MVMVMAYNDLFCCPRPWVLPKGGKFMFLLLLIYLWYIKIVENECIVKCDQNDFTKIELNCKVLK